MSESMSIATEPSGMALGDTATAADPSVMAKLKPRYQRRAERGCMSRRRSGDGASATPRAETMTRRVWRHFTPLPLALALVAGAACQSSQAPAHGPGETGQSAPAAPAVAVLSRPSLAPLAEVATDLPSVLVRVLGLQRVAPNVVELRLELQNQADAPTDLKPLAGEGAWLAESSVATADGQRRFFVLRDASGAMSSIEPPSVLDAAQAVAISARFGAVPVDVTTLDFSAAHIQPVRGLSIQP